MTLKRLLWLGLFCTAMTPLQAGAWGSKLDKVEHIVVITLENHSFDNLFGFFPDAEGIDQAGKKVIQTDLNGKPYSILPVVKDTRHQYSGIDRRFPDMLPNKPFPIDPYVGANERTGDLVHRFYQQQAQIHGGKMDRFAAISDAGGLTMGYWDGTDTVLWDYAKRYVLADRFFHAAFGGSFLNHFWLVCACTPRYPNAPTSITMWMDRNGEMVKDGAVTLDGYAVNTLYPTYSPKPDKVKPEQLLPPQTMPTIGDRLSDKNISWAWYAGGWDNAVAGKPDSSFQFHHQPFVFFKNFAEGTEERKKHLKDGEDFLRDLRDDTLPAVSFYKPLGEFSLHPGYAENTSGDEHLGSILQAIEASKAWPNTVVIVTFDENGGYWDHVAPPVIDRWGPGVRVPTLIISPLITRPRVDHTVYDTTSILKFIETRFDLAPLAKRDANIADLSQVITSD